MTMNNLVLVCLSSLPLLVASSNILMMPVMMKSHYSVMLAIARELAESRGHHVDILVADTFDISKNTGLQNVHVITYHTEMDVAEVNDKLAEIQIAGDQMGGLNFVNEVTTVACRNVLVDSEELLMSLENANYDIAVMDALFTFKCFYLVPHRLRLPVVSVVDMMEPWLARLPWFPSVVPLEMLPYSDNMSFYERLSNTFMQLLFQCFPPFESPSPEIMQKYENYGPIGNLDDLLSKTQVWLFNSDPVLRYALPLLPNVIEVGGLTTSSAKPLPESLSSLIQRSSKGFILVSFGSSADKLPKAVTGMFMRVLGSIDMLVIWRLRKPEDIDVPTNVHLMDWLPQNDLLGDKRIRLFISHCGKNGLYEALDHAVPILGVPLWGDQTFNAQAIKNKHFGEFIDLHHTTDEEFNVTINRVLADTTYNDAIQLGSARFHHQVEQPAERAAHWVEHVMKFGGDHLRTYAFQLTWYQYLMLDILLVLLLALSFLIFIMYKLMKCCRRWCMHRLTVKTKTH